MACALRLHARQSKECRLAAAIAAYRREASMAITMINSSGATGLVKCI